MSDLFPFVIEFGSHSIKAGFGNSKKRIPSFVLPTIVGKVIGSGVYEDKPELSFVTPFRREKIESKAAYEDLLEYTVEQLLELSKKSAQECSVLITFPLNGSREDLNKLYEILYDKYKFGAVHVTSDAEMSLMASGKPTGVVVQMGHEVTSIVAIIDNTPQKIMYLEHLKYETIDLAGRDLSEFLKSEIPESFKFNSPQGQKEADKYKEENCFVSLNYEKELQKFKNSETKNSPDDVMDEIRPKPANFKFINNKTAISKKYSSMLQFGEFSTSSTSSPVPKSQTVFEGPEAFFQSGIIGTDRHRLPEKIYNVITKCDNIDYHGLLYGNIILSGGSSKIKGLRERLKVSIKGLAPGDAQVNISFPHERDPSESDGGYTSEEPENEGNPKTGSPGIESLELAAFRGACKLTQLPHYVSLLKTKDQYGEIPIMRSRTRRSVRISRPPSIALYAADN